MPITNLLFGRKRTRIGSFIVDATTREVHNNEAVVTRNPVEEGVDITDHVRVMPKQLILEGVVSDTPITLSVFENIAGIVGTIVERTAGRSLSKDAYDFFNDLMNKREPIQVVTGLKAYNNMIITNFSVPRTVSTANAIHFRMILEEIQVARTQRFRTDSNLGGGVISLGAFNIDLGNQLSIEVPSSSPIALGNNVVTFGSQQVSGATGVFNVLGGLRGLL